MIGPTLRAAGAFRQRRRGLGNGDTDYRHYQERSPAERPGERAKLVQAKMNYHDIDLSEQSRHSLSTTLVCPHLSDFGSRILSQLMIYRGICFKHHLL